MNVHTHDHPESTDLIGSGGIHLRGYHWLPEGAPRAIVIIAHGKDEHIGRYGHVVKALTDGGFAVFGHDHRGHGRSDGSRGVIKRFDDYIDDLDLLIEYAHDRDPQRPIVLLGHSMGGLIATRYAIAHQSKLDALILSGPALLVAESTPGWQKLLILTLGKFFPSRPVPTSTPATLSRDPEVNRQFLLDPLCNNGPTQMGFVRELYLAAQDTRPRTVVLDLPLLVMHGEADQLTSPRGSQYCFDHAVSTDKTIKFWPDAHHEIFNELNKGEVISFMLDWLTTRFSE